MNNLYPEVNLRSYTPYAYVTMLFSGRFSFSRFRPVVLLVFLFSAVLNAGVSYAQMGINSVTASASPASAGKTYTGPGNGIDTYDEYKPSSRNTFTYKFGTASGLSNGSMSVNGYIAGGSAFSVVTSVSTTVVMRRVNNALVTGNRDILSFTGNRTPGINVTGQTWSSLTINLNTKYVADMGASFSQNNLLVGADNIFSNQGNNNGNNNNIERMDVMVPAGFRVLDAQKYGFPVLERGAYNGHDAFKVAVITGINSSGNPSAYSKVVSVKSSNYNNTTGTNPVADAAYTYFTFRRDGTSDLQANYHISNQGIGGVAFRFSDFGINNNTIIYGYSIMADDFNSTLGSNVVDYTNSAHYPRNTSESIGGIDPLAVMSISMETTILPVKMVSFTAKNNAGKSDLQWTTVTEINNKGFHIERSTDGTNWTEIAFVRSKASEGNSTMELKYSYEDSKPDGKDNYYRIAQEDFNDNKTISETRLVSFANDQNAIRTFPNPVINTIYVQGVTKGSDLVLTDIKGSVIMRTTAKSATVSIPSDKLSPGIYFVGISNDNAMLKTVKIIKI